MQTITTHRRMLLGILLLLAVRAGAFDQKDYKAYAETVRQEVWGMDLPEFRHPKPTDRFADQSAVILAAYDEYDVTKRDKFNFFSATGTVAEVKCYTITRQQVQINDEAALKLYSEFDFMSYARRRSLYFGKMEMRRVLGVRIIKPDGTVSEVPTDDYVVTTEGTKGRDERQKTGRAGPAGGRHHRRLHLCLQQDERPQPGADDLLLRLRQPHAVLSRPLRDRRLAGHAIHDPQRCA